MPISELKLEEDDLISAGPTALPLEKPDLGATCKQGKARENTSINRFHQPGADSPAGSQAISNSTTQTVDNKSGALNGLKPACTTSPSHSRKEDGSVTGTVRHGEPLTLSEASNSTFLDKSTKENGFKTSQTSEKASMEGQRSPTIDVAAIGAMDGISGWSHQALAPHKEKAKDQTEDDEWQDMPAIAPYDLYNDSGKLIAREARDSDDDGDAYAGLGGAGKGYTRVQVDEDAQSATSMDENTSYLFKAKDTDVANEEDEQRDAVAQMQATKNLLTEGQRIAYVGITRLMIAQMVKEAEDIERTKTIEKELKILVESMMMWSQRMMLRLYAHMDIDSSGMVRHQL